MVSLLRFLVLPILIGGSVNSDVSSWFTSPHHKAHHQGKYVRELEEDPHPLHPVANATEKGEKQARDVHSGSAAAAQSSATASSGVRGPVFPGGAFGLPSLGYAPMGGYPGPFAGFFPGFGGGVGVESGFSADFFGGASPYFPIIEKVVVIVGGGILILIFLAIIHSLLTKKGLLMNTVEFGGSGSKAFSGGFSVDAGPFHVAKSGAGSAAFQADPHLTHRVMNGIHRKW